MSKRTVSFSQKAMEDIEAIVRYLSEHRPRAAQEFREDLERACDLLAGMPHLGRLHDFGHPMLTEVRGWPLKHFEKYLLFYRASDEALVVIRVIHGGRDLPTLFGEEVPRA